MSFPGRPERMAAMTNHLWSCQAQMPSVLGRQIEIVAGDGAYVTTADGRRLLDATAALWFANVGHGRVELADAARAQMARLETYHVFGRFVTDVALALADRVAGLVPIQDPRIVLTSGGSDSIDAACKLARRYWQAVGRDDKTVILSRRDAYHGLHGFGTSIAGIAPNREGYGSDSLVPETARIDPLDIDLVAKEIDVTGPERIAAVVAEPVMGTGGVYPPPPGYLEGLQRLCREHDILLVADEVITGFGRTGTMFASQRYGITPDLLTMAKGITSGYAPLGGVVVAPRVWQPFYDGPEAPVFRHGLTYSGHATACAVAMANLDILQREGLVARAGELELTLDGALDAARGHELVAGVRIGGFLGAIEVTGAVDAERALDLALDAGVILRVLQGRALQISPPFVVTDDEVARIVEVALHAIEGARR